jgi:hypothetical protein
VAATTRVKRKGSESGHACPVLPIRPARRAAMPLAALARLTAAFREARALGHDAEAKAAATAAQRAWYAIGQACPLWKTERVVRRIRRRRHDYRDRKGRARRTYRAERVNVAAHDAFESSRKWHDGRAQGQRSRLETAAHCGVGSVTVECTCCGVVRESPVWCGIVRLCEGCNVRRSMRMRARFATSLRIVLAQAEAAGSLRRNRPGGALGQHHIVLTAPHVEVMGERCAEGSSIDRGATAKARIELVFAAWRRMSRELQAWLREPWTGLRQTIGAVWHRAFEWTVGADGCGHPHFHLWALTPWLPEHDDHRVASILDGKPRASLRCKAPRRMAGAWGWAEMMRREQCPACVPPESFETRDDGLAPAPDGAWGWARELRRARVAIWVKSAPPAPDGAWGWARELVRARTLDDYYLTPRAARWRSPAVERRRGLRSWWADALAAEGAPVDERIVNVSVRKAFARPQEFIREVQKPNGITYRERKVRRIEIVDASGALLDYFESWCLAFVDQETWELAGPDVIAGVYEALEGKRLSQSSRVLLRTRSGGERSVGFLGIADSFADGSCRDCNDVAMSRGLPPPPFPERRIDVVTWARKAQVDDDVKWPRGPPAELSTADQAAWETPEERYRALVASLRLGTPEAARRAREGTARLAWATEAIRTDPGLLLPSYRRSGRVRGLARRGAPE